MRRLIAAYHANAEFTGNVLVADPKGVIYLDSFDEADRTWHVPNTAQTRFLIASMTKSFTAMLILQLVHEGRIELNAPISRYLPDYRKDTGDRVTVDQLLSHRSGFPDYANSDVFYHQIAPLSYARNDFIKRYLSNDLEFIPGKAAKYDSTGYFLLGLIIEGVTGKSFALNLSERILEPLGLLNTGYEADGQIVQRHASGYLDGYTFSRLAPYINLNNFFSAAAMYSTTEDLLTWMRAVDGTSLLPVELRDRMFHAYAPDFYQPEISYGYGWEVGMWEIAPGLRVAVHEHGGNEPGFRGQMTEFTDRGYIVILLENSGDGLFSEMPQEITKGLAAILYGRAPKLPQIPLERQMAKYILHGQLESALTLYRQFHAADQYSINDYTLTKLTDELISVGKASDAIRILQVAASYDARSARIQGALGDAYLATGQRQMAIQAYRNVLLINPNSTRAKDKLRDLGIDIP